MNVSFFAYNYWNMLNILEDPGKLFELYWKAKEELKPSKYCYEVLKMWIENVRDQNVKAMEVQWPSGERKGTSIFTAHNKCNMII